MAGKGTLTIRLIGDSTDLDHKLKGATTSLGKFGDRAASTGDKMAGLGNKMSLFTTLPVVAGLTAATSAASNLNEVVSKSNTVFGENGAEIEKWAEGAAKGFGQSKRQALEAASSFGNMFTQLGIGSETAANMSTSMVELASDFASFHNADITDVLMAQEAAFRGEYDSIQRFVPTMNAAAIAQEAMAMSGKTSTKALTDQEKALAAQKLMIEGAGDATGDFARTQDGAANASRMAKAQIEDASAALGEQLLPIAAGAASKVGALAEKFSELPKPAQTAIVAVGGIAAVSGPILTVSGNVVKLAGHIGDVADKAKKMGTALSGVPWGPVAAVIAVGTIALMEWQSSKAEAKRLTEEFTEALRADSGALGENTTALILNRLEQRGQTDDLARAGVTLKDVTRAVEGDEKARRALVERLRQEGEANSGLLITLASLFQQHDASIIKERDRAKVVGEVTAATQYASAAARDYAERLGQIPTAVRTTIEQSYTSRGSASQPIVRRAKGGPVAAGQVALVGEEGPEIVQFGAAGHVTPNHKLGGGGNTFNVTINQIPGQTPDDIVRAMVEWARRNGGAIPIRASG